MEKKKKIIKSSDKGYIGVFYRLYLRALKSPKQRESIKTNLKSIEGLERLLKNKDPRYWFVAMGEMSSHQADNRWIGFNRILGHIDNPNTKLIKAFQHRSIHSLRLDNKDYLADKLFVVDYCIHLCSLYHPKFLKDYIDFYYNLDELVENTTIHNRSENHTIFKSVKYNEIHQTILNILETIKDCIMKWDYQYPQPQYLQDFFVYAEEKVNFYLFFWENIKFKMNIAQISYTLQYIVYHNKKSNIFLDDLEKNNKKIAEISIENIINDFEELSQILWFNKEFPYTEKNIDFVESLKNSVYHLLKELNSILVYFDYAYDFEKNICIDFYKKYQQKFDTFFVFIKEVERDMYDEHYEIKISTYWNIKNNVKDYLLYDLLRCLNSNIYCVKVSSSELEEKKENNDE